MALSNPKDVEKYIENRGASCLYCGSHSLTGGPFTAEGGEAWQVIFCEECGSEWQDVYTLVQVVDMEGNDLKEVNDEEDQ